MIGESYYWKRELLKAAESLRKIMSLRRWLDPTAARYERTVMLGFYSIRKLAESGLLSDFAVATRVAVRSYPPTGRTITRFNNRSPERLYKLDYPRDKTVELLFLCNQFIHSHVYMTVHREDWALADIWVSSDRNRSKELIEISAQTIVELFDLVGHDEVVAMNAQFDEKLGDFVYQNFRTYAEQDQAMERRSAKATRNK